MRNYIFIIYLIFLFSSCNSIHEEPADLFQPSEKSETVKASVVATFSKWAVDEPQGIVKQDNNLTVLNRTAHNNLTRIDLSANRRSDYITRSRSNGQAFYTSALDASGKETTTLNFQTGQLYVTPKAAPDETYCLQLPAGEQHLIAAKTDRFIISTGLYTQGRYLLYSLEDSSSNYYLSYPEHPTHKGLSEYAKSVLYASSVLRIRPDGAAFACTDMRCGIIDICRITGNSIERIKQQCFYFPKVYATGSTPKDVEIRYDRGTIHGFIDMAVSDTRIFVLYSGKSLLKDRYDLDHCQTLLIFNWEGNLLDTRTLEIPASNICYDNNEKVLYGIGYTPEVSFVKYTL